MLLHALAGVFLVFQLARACGLRAGAAVLAALLLATSPLYVFTSLTLMSDTPALVWTTAAVLLAWKSRGHPAWAGVAGLAMSAAVLVRPTCSRSTDRCTPSSFRTRWRS
jgi:4-amino-4-deoxy-L-arabinose transferase-like glycosyltransferase